MKLRAKVLTVVERAAERVMRRLWPMPADEAEPVVLSRFAMEFVDQGASEPFGPPFVGDTVHMRGGHLAMVAKVWMEEGEKRVRLRRDDGRWAVVPAAVLTDRKLIEEN
jgi:hypothetical protein